MSSNSDYEGIAVVLGRVVPTRLPEAVDELAQELAAAMGLAAADATKMVSLACMGRHDFLLLLRTPKLEQAARATRPRGIRKVDIDYGYVRSDQADDLFDMVSTAPLVAATYGKFNDLLGQDRGIEGHDHCAVEVCQGLGPKAFAINLLGWFDVLFLAPFDGIAALTGAVNGLWDGQIPNISPAVPMFFRTYSTIGFPTSQLSGPPEDMFGGVSPTDTVISPRIEMRIRLGQGKRVEQATTDMLRIRPARLRGLEFLKRDVKVLPRFSQELGHEDAVVSFPMDRPLASRTFLRSYWGSFLRTVKDCVHSTQLCIGVAGDVATSKFGQADITGTLSYPHIPVAPIPYEQQQELISALWDAPTAAAVTDSLHALYQACDWAVENEALLAVFADLHWHLRWLLETADLQSLVAQPSRELNLKVQHLDNAIQMLGQAFSQRLTGTYYTLVGYRPEYLFSHVVALHKIIMGLWGLHNAVLAQVHESLSGPEETFAPHGYWIISHGTGPAVFSDNHKFARAVQLPGAEVIQLESLLVDAGHEIGHLHCLYLNGRDADLPIEKRRGVWTTWVWKAIIRASGLLPAETISGSDPGATSPLQFRVGDEVFADSFALNYLLGDAVDLYIGRIVEYHRRMSGLNAEIMLLRAYLQYGWIKTRNLESQFMETQSTIRQEDGVVYSMDDLPGLLDSGSVMAWVGAAVSWGKNGGKLSDVDTSFWSQWGGFVDYLDREFGVSGISRDVRVALSECHGEGLLTPPMAMAYNSAIWFARQWSTHLNESEAGNDALRGLTHAWREAASPYTEGSAFNKRVTLCNALWAGCIRLLQGVFEPNKEGEEASPWVRLKPSL